MYNLTNYSRNFLELQAFLKTISGCNTKATTTAHPSSSLLQCRCSLPGTVHDTGTICSDTNQGLSRSVLATTIKNVPHKAFLLTKALKTRLKSTQSSEVGGWGRSMLTPECTHSPGTQGSLPTQNSKWNAVHLPSWLISGKKNWTPKWEWYTKTTFLLRWKRRLQRCFSLAGFPDPGSTSHCPQPPSSQGA